MKIDCGPSWLAKHEAKKRWHRWFAWRPVRLGENDCRWLESVWRKGTFWDCWGAAGWDWKYAPGEGREPAE